MRDTRQLLHSARAAIPLVLALFGCASSGPELGGGPTGGARAAPETPEATGSGAPGGGAGFEPPEGVTPIPDPGSGTGELLIYTAITGHHPFPNRPGAGLPPVPTDPSAWGEQGEEARGEALEKEIERELERRQAAEDGLESAGAPGRATIESLITGEQLAERANPRIAPKAPEDRELPPAVFDVERVTIVAGSWGNDQTLEVRRGVLDVDSDGRPEEIRYFEKESDRLLRLESDRDYDGIVDTWQSYDDGVLIRRLRDTNGDGQPDVWETYASARMTTRTIDRDRDGVPDAFYRYDGEALVDERHDPDNNGTVNLVVTYQNLYRVRSEEDRNRDGWMDTWTTYRVVSGDELVIRIERASQGSGDPDIFETYDTSSGKAVLAVRQEDANGDGEIDITSRYENGKLVQREISNPDLAPL